MLCFFGKSTKTDEKYGWTKNRQTRSRGNFVPQCLLHGISTTDLLAFYRRRLNISKNLLHRSCYSLPWRLLTRRKHMQRRQLMRKRKIRILCKCTLLLERWRVYARPRLPTRCFQLSFKWLPNVKSRKDALFSSLDKLLSLCFIVYLISHLFMFSLPRVVPQ